MKLLALARSVDVAAKNQWLHLAVISLFGMLVLIAFLISVLGYVSDWYWTGVPKNLMMDMQDLGSSWVHP